MNSNRIRFTVLNGAEDGRVIETDKIPVLLGRHPADDILLSRDNRVSRHHARVTKQGDSYFIEDVGPEGKGSTNGTYVDGQKIAGLTRLVPGNVFLLGAVLVRFELKPETE